MKEESQQTIRIGEKSYLLSSLTTDGINLVADIRKTESVINQQQLAVSVSSYAKTKLMGELAAMTDSFTEIDVPTTDVQEAANDE